MTSNDFGILKWHWQQSTPSESMFFFDACPSAKLMFLSECEWTTERKGLAVVYSFKDAPFLSFRAPKPDAVFNIEGEDASWYIWLFDDEK